MKTVIQNLEGLGGFAGKLVQGLVPNPGRATIITLTGNLGAGKTTLTQRVAAELGVTEPVASPTFVIMKYYDLKKQPWRRLVHVDAYRLEDQPTEPLGLDELFADPNNIIIIEWPDMLGPATPTPDLALTITRNKDESRTIVLKR